MAIGDVSASGGLSLNPQQDRASRIDQTSALRLGESINGLVRAGMGYLESGTKLDEMYVSRARKSMQMEIDTGLVEWQRQQAEDYTVFSRERSSNPLGMTKEYSARLDAAAEDFLKGVPPMFHEEYQARLRQDKALRVSSAFMAELEALDTVDQHRLQESLNTIGSALRGGGVDLEDAEARWQEMVGNSGLPAEVKHELARQGAATLQGLEFNELVTQSAKGYGVASVDWSGGDVVAAGLAPQQRGVLNAIASREAKSYNVWNGGATFEDYSDHPAAKGKPPGASSAAGRYQFTLGTWRQAAASFQRTYGIAVPSFEPEWQDRVADHWAETIFNKWNGEGLTYQQVLKSGDPAQIVKIRRVLGNPKIASNPNSVEWEGWADRSFGGDSAKADAAFLEVFGGAKGVAGGGSGAPQLPNVWTDPRYAQLSLEEKQQYANAAWDVAKDWRTQESARIKTERTQFNTEMYELGYSSGDLSLMGQFAGNQYWSGEAEREFRKGVDAFEQKTITIGEVQNKLSAGEALSPRDMKAYGQWFGDAGYQGIAAGDDAAISRLAYGFTQSGKLPPDIVGVFREGMANPEVSAKLAEVFASIHAGSPGALTAAGFSAKDLTDLQVFADLARTASPQQTGELWERIQAQEAVSGKSPDALRKEAAKQWAEKDLSSSILSSIAQPTFASRFSLDSVQISNQNLAVFNREAAEAYQLGFAIYGDPKQAETYARETMAEKWGVSHSLMSVGEDGRGRPAVMKFPPEKYYPASEGTYEYLYNTARDMFTAELPDGVEISRSSIRFVPDTQTDREVLAGQPPTYNLVGETKDGQLIVLPQRFGGEALAVEGARAKEEELGRSSFQEEYEGLTDLHTSMMLQNAMGWIDYGVDEDGRRLATNDERSMAQQEAWADLETRIQSLENEGVAQGWLSPEKVERERGFRKARMESRGVVTTDNEPVSPALADLRESIVSGDVTEERKARATVVKLFGDALASRPADAEKTELWDRRFIVEGVAKDPGLVRYLLDPDLATMAGDIIPAPLQEAAAEFEQRLGERFETMGKLMARTRPTATAEEIEAMALTGLVRDWTDYGPSMTKALVDEIMANRGNQ